MSIRSTGLLIAAFLFLAGCAGQEAQPGGPAQANGDAIRVDLNQYTPGLIPQGIGEPVKMARVIADEWEAAHPGSKIKYQLLIDTGSGDDFLKTQLLGGIAPEIINRNAETTWQDTDKGWFVPLDEFLERPNPYVPGNEHWIDIFANQALAGAKRAPDGKLYCIPIDIVETGLFYNKTLLAELGVHEMPETWAGMLEVMETVKRAGYIPMTGPTGGSTLSINLPSDWGQDIVFELLYHDILPELDLIPSRPDAEGYLGHYLEASEAAFLSTKGFFSRRDPRWREMNRIVKEWRAYWGPEIKNSDFIRLFLTGRAATFWNGSWFIRRMVNDPYIDFEWGITYIPTITKETSPYGSGTPATVIGGAAIQLHVTNSAIINDCLEECIDFLMFLSAPQNMERLASEALIFIPNIVGAKMDERLEPFSEIFQRRYCAMKWLESMDGRYKKFWRRMLDYYLNDGIELDEFLALLEDNFAGWVEDHRGDAGWDFTAMEATWKEREERLVRELEPAS